MNGAEILVECLEREGVDVVFAYPGACSMPIHQALTKTKKIRTILPRHEQGGDFAAEGYAVIDQNIVADYSGFTNDNAHSVVDDQTAANLGPRVNFDAG